MKGLKPRYFQGITGGLLLLAVFVLPVFAFADSDDIFVDKDADGKQDGSKRHPYKTISRALKHADSGDEVHIASGKYKENIEIPERVKVFGSDKDDVIIEAEDDDEPVVTMEHKSSIEDVTIRGGKDGVRVKGDGRALISKCIIKDNDRDGVHALKAKVEDKYALIVIDSEIKDNGKAGVFSEKRRVVLIDNKISDNRSNGADLAADSKAWIDKNSFRDNRGSGLKVVLDGSSVFVDSGNSFVKNKRDGIEVNSFGRAGTVNVKKSRFLSNAGFGVAKIQRGSAASGAWNGLVLTGNAFDGSNKGDVSRVIVAR
jgi:hypothetical protein